MPESRVRLGQGLRFLPQIPRRAKPCSMKHHAHRCHLMVHSEGLLCPQCPRGAEDAEVAGLPGSVILPGSHWSRKAARCVTSRWSGEQEDCSAISELGQAKSVALKTRTRARGHLTKTTNSVFLRDLLGSSAGRRGGFSLRVLYHLSFYESLLHNIDT